MLPLWKFLHTACLVWIVSSNITLPQAQSGAGPFLSVWLTFLSPSIIKGIIVICTLCLPSPSLVGHLSVRNPSPSPLESSVAMSLLRPIKCQWEWVTHFQTEALRASSWFHSRFSPFAMQMVTSHTEFFKPGSQINNTWTSGKLTWTFLYVYVDLK